MPGDTYYEISSKPAGDAYNGDPGMYINGKFEEPSTLVADVTVNENSHPSIFSSISVKWHFIDYLYLETGYSYYGKTGTNITGLSVKTRYTKEEKYDMDASIFLTDRHVIYLGIGVGF
ncbi:MAG: hypothetical protein MdMp014T_0049 [Treponematales bacterium]